MIKIYLNVDKTRILSFVALFLNFPGHNIIAIVIWLLGPFCCSTPGFGLGFDSTQHGPRILSHSSSPVIVWLR